jgi:hypothetical protein
LRGRFLLPAESPYDEGSILDVATTDGLDKQPSAPAFDVDPLIARAWRPPRIPRATYRVQLH